LPSGIRVCRLIDPRGLDDVAAVGLEAFGLDFSALNAEYAARMPLGTVAFYVAFSDSRPVGAGRLEMPALGEFAGLYGGGTVPAFRRCGIYRSLVAARAREARTRGYRYLNVEAEPPSRPILERLGFVPLTSVRAWIWHPPGDATAGQRS
ncbi:MAG TPA: GNAT family N-acetyltransferase, partial [Gammaproteobacteria bacterium]|nr:GNAT family N-acetyltransferase [Gammaproteobacteria bacterium]